MTTPDCSQNTDPLKLVREGTSQSQRAAATLDPATVLVDAKQLQHDLVFAQAYSKVLRFYNLQNTEADNWEAFFNQDVSTRLALAAIQEVDFYKANVKASFDYLNDRSHKDDEPSLKRQLGYLFSYVGTLARQLEQLKTDLPPDIPLQQTLSNLIRSQLAPALAKLIAYYRALPNSDATFAKASPNTGVIILGSKPLIFSQVFTFSFSKDWIPSSATDWKSYLTTIKPDQSVYGTSLVVFERINHIATHNLFAGIFDQFLKVYARVVQEAKTGLATTLNDWNRHTPHSALLLAFLQLYDYARAETNTLSQRHLDFYYRDILQLKEKSAVASHAHLLVELGKQVESHQFKTGELFKAGKDDLGKEAFFANDQDFVANQALVTSLKTVYRHIDDDLANVKNRIFASPIANSADGLGKKLETVDQSWQPFANKMFVNGKLTDINMPKAQIGFAVASHYLALAAGKRTIIINLSVTGSASLPLGASDPVFTCWLSSEKGWFVLPAAASTFLIEAGQLTLTLDLTGADPAVIPYSAKLHGYDFDTNLPMVLVQLTQDEHSLYGYVGLQALQLQAVKVSVVVEKLKQLAVSNDFGPVDTAKPFQPFGASPVQKSALTIGCKEAFQKSLASATVNMTWQNPPTPYGTGKVVKLDVLYLLEGEWQSNEAAASNITGETFSLNIGSLTPSIDAPDFSEPELYQIAAKQGFVRLQTDSDFGQPAFEQELIRYIKLAIDTNTGNDINKPTPPTGPFATALSLDYTSHSQTTQLDSSNTDAFTSRASKFFHITPFGQAEQHYVLNDAKPVFLLPQFSLPVNNSTTSSNAEFYIGIAGLKAPQNLSLLFQLVDGSADPLTEKSKPQHIVWSYLSNNRWLNFETNAVQDATLGLLDSGLIVFAIPELATSNNTLLPSGQIWLRGAVASATEAVCRIITIAAQGMQVTFQDQANDPAFPAKPLAPDTINKLVIPNAAVKKISQPFASFGGKASEAATAFYTRISERLRHKDRAIGLWDFEHLVLEVFPDIYQAKCLNHTEYEPTADGTGTYRELAPGHVTLVTIPNQQAINQRDPLRPYTSLGLLEKITDFLRLHVSCFVQLHVKNPQFEEVSVAGKVKLLAGYDEVFYINTLKTAITQFLSPWAYSANVLPSFGGKIYQSVLINFIEDQPYVDYVTDFQLLQHMLVDGVLTKLAQTEVAGSKAVSILVSVPAEQHDLKALHVADHVDTINSCACASL